MRMRVDYRDPCGPISRDSARSGDVAAMLMPGSMQNAPTVLTCTFWAGWQRAGGHAAAQLRAGLCRQGGDIEGNRLPGDGEHVLPGGWIRLTLREEEGPSSLP